MSPLVLALSGTDHHPFDRLVHWMDDAAARHPDVRFLVQHGRSTPPTIAEGTVVQSIDRMCSNTFTSAASAAMLVESESGESLSPK